MLKWLHTIISNAKAFVEGTYHGMERKHVQLYLDEFCYRFNRRLYHENLFERLALAMSFFVVLYDYKLVFLFIPLIICFLWF